MSVANTGISARRYIVFAVLGNDMIMNVRNIRGTPATGDQGADLIVKKDHKIIIIQAKRHKRAVCNKAVQEVIGALHFYSGDT